MLTLPLAFLVMAAVASGGLLLTGLIAARQPIPGWLGSAHGLAALAGLCLLFATNLTQAETPPLAWVALGVFLAGLVGGLLLFRVLFRQRATLWLAMMHGSLGGVGLYLLYLVAFPAGF